MACGGRPRGRAPPSNLSFREKAGALEFVPKTFPKSEFHLSWYLMTLSQRENDYVL